MNACLPAGRLEPLNPLLEGDFGDETQKENLHRTIGPHQSDPFLFHLSALVCPLGGIEEHPSLPSPYF